MPVYTLIPAASSTEKAFGPIFPVRRASTLRAVNACAAFMPAPPSAKGPGFSRASKDMES